MRLLPLALCVGRHGSNFRARVGVHSFFSFWPCRRSTSSMTRRGFSIVPFKRKHEKRLTFNLIYVPVPIGNPARPFAGKVVL